MREYNLLETLKAQVETTDKEIVFLVKRRLQTAKKIVDYLSKNESDFSLENFEAEVVKNLSNLARQMKLREKFVLEFYEMILDESKKVQDDFLEEKANRV